MHDCTNGASGFTLIELSIVLVIIGLIVGGVLAGQDMVSSAAVRAQVAQIEKYNTAVNTFKVKYGYLPGDIPDPYASNFGFQARGAFAGEGDGNGLIEGIWSNLAASDSGECQSSGETVAFWTDLSAARLIDANLTMGGAYAWPPNTYIAANLYPPAKIGNGNYIYVWSDRFALAYGTPVNSNANFFGIAVVTPGGCPFGAATTGLTVAQAYNLDKKIDDGLPQSGSVTAIYLNPLVTPESISWAAGGGGTGTSAGGSATGTTSTCYDNAGAGTMHYSMEIANGANVNCAISFQMQGAAR